MKTMLVTSSLAVGAVLAMGAISAKAEPRTFTSSDGKEIQAEVLAVREGKASLKLAGGKTFEVPLGRLSEGDQTFLKAWAKENVSYGLTDLRLDLSKVRKTERTQKDKKKKATKTSDISWEGTLQNNTRETIDDIKISYTVFCRNFYRSDTSSSETLDDVEGVTEVGSLEGGAVYEFESDKVQEYNKVEKGGKGERDTTDRQAVLGAIFKVSIKGKELITFEDPRGIAAKVADERRREEERENR